MLRGRLPNRCLDVRQGKVSFPTAAIPLLKSSPGQGLIPSDGDRFRRVAIRTGSASDTTSIFWMTRAQSATETGTGFEEYRTKSVNPQALLQLVARPTRDLEVYRLVSIERSPKAADILGLHAHRRVWLEEETVKLRSQNVKSRDADDDAGRCAFWPQNTNLRWVHMLPHRVAVICTMEFTSAVARWCIMPDSRAASTEEHWKRFFSLLSHRAGVSGSDPMPYRASIAER